MKLKKNIELLFLEAAETRMDRQDKILSGKLLQKYIDTFKTGRKDSKAWNEAADFLEEHFDEKKHRQNRHLISMLSKSKFILGQQCIKSFWFDVNNVEPTNPTDEAAEARLSAGNEVGDISKRIFPGGKEVPYLPGESEKMFEITKQLIDEGITSIYEASFIYDDIFIRVDLMHKTKMAGIYMR